MNIASIDLERHLSSRRLRHSRAVAQTAIRLNHIHEMGLDDQELAAAGLYHDLAREWDAKALVDYAQGHHLDVTEQELAKPVLLHGPVAAHLLGQAGASEAVMQAIRHHTLGSIQMGPMGLLLYLADALEPNRTHLTEKERMHLMQVRPIEAMALAVIEEERLWRKTELLEPTKELYRALKEELKR